MSNTILQKISVKNPFTRISECGRVFLAGLTFIFMAGALTQGQSPVRLSQSADTGNYRIGPGDVLKIVILKQDLLTQDNVRVSNEGTIRMPMLSETIPATCVTEAELSAEITNRYKQYILNPQVYVTVKEFNSNPVAVVGAVVAPGRFQLQRPTRLFDLLAQVNGPAQNAGKEVQIIRTSNAAPCLQNSSSSANRPAETENPRLEIISIALVDVLKGNDDANPYIQGGDVIRINEAEIKQAFVIGNVKSSVVVNLKEPVALSRAIAMAGGLSSGAKAEKIKIARQGQNEIIVNYKEIARGKQEDILLQPNDVVDVPGTKPSILKGIVQSLIPTLLRVPVAVPIP